MRSNKVWRPLNTYGLLAIGLVAASTVVYNLVILINAC